MSPTAAKALPVERIGPAAKITSHAAAPSGDVNVLSLLVPISEASLTTPSTSVVESDTARTSSPGLVPQWLGAEFTRVVYQVALVVHRSRQVKRLGESAVVRQSTSKSIGAAVKSARRRHEM